MRGIVGASLQDRDGVTILDLEAGLEHLKRGTPGSADELLVVVEPYFRSVESATHVADLGRELGIASVRIVANKIRDDRDADMIGSVFEGHGLTVLGTVPFDPAVMDADRIPAALIDLAPQSPSVRAVESLADAFGPPRSSSRAG